MTKKYQKGEQRPQHKLTEADVIAIRMLDPSVSMDYICSLYPHMSKIGLWKARIGYTWKHVGVPPIESRSKLVKHPALPCA